MGCCILAGTQAHERVEGGLIGGVVPGRCQCWDLSLQLQFSDVLTKWRRFFHQMAAEQGKAGLAAKDTRLEVAALQVGLLSGDWGEDLDQEGAE